MFYSDYVYGSMEDVFISVVITAYNRKEFLLDAIKSAFNQTLSNNKYEIIVIKNFNDEVTDRFIDNNKIKNILMNGTIGEFLYKGINESHGKVISFLDDDDLFLTNKLEYIYNLFEHNHNLAYYHNDYIPVDEDNKAVKFRNNDIDFNMSCISIKKDIIPMSNLKKINMSQDVFMYMSALDFKGKIIRNNKKFTYYKLHNSTSHSVTNNFTEYEQALIKFKNECIASFIMFRKMFKSKKALRLIRSYITDTDLGLLLSGYVTIDKIKLNDFLIFLIYRSRPLKEKIEITIAYISIELFGTRSLKFIKKIRKHHFDEQR